MSACGQDVELCETCLERGRERQATRITEDLQMCEDCFGGKPFRPEEKLGVIRLTKAERDREWRQANLERSRAYHRKYQQSEKRREYMRRWRAENAERVRGYRAAHRQEGE